MADMVREIAFDTETTGLEWSGEDRIIELGAVELVNHVPTGKTFQTYVNPGRPVSEATIRITGITDADLVDKPGFEDPSIVDAFLDFVGDADLVAHNADFDRNFLNMELARCGRDTIPEDRWVDTLQIAKKRHPGAPASLDALCKRYDISLSGRAFHGALLDSQLLARAYLELLGGRARAFDFGEQTALVDDVTVPAKQRTAPLKPAQSDAETAAHTAFVSELGGDAIWNRYN
ncbi:MAG: DNA polymerase III subunit epsilon [Pseudomonadota bacterium]